MTSLQNLPMPMLTQTTDVAFADAAAMFADRSKHFVSIEVREGFYRCVWFQMTAEEISAKCLTGCQRIA